MLKKKDNVHILQITYVHIYIHTLTDLTKNIIKTKGNGILYSQLAGYRGIT